MDVFAIPKNKYTFYGLSNLIEFIMKFKTFKREIKFYFLKYYAAFIGVNLAVIRY